MKGQSLIESVLALAVIAIILSVIAVTVTSSLNNADFGKNQTISTQYAQQGLEILRKIRNSNYSAFASYSGNYCLAKGTSVLQHQNTCLTPLAPNVDEFIRSVSINQAPGCGPSVAKATVKVAWTDGKCGSGAYCHSSNIVTCLSTTNPIQAP